MVQNKQLLRPHHILKDGDVMLEISRFNKKQYVIWQISKVNYIEDSMTLTCVSSGEKAYQKGYSCWAMISAHYNQKNCKQLTYLLPAGQVLYGS